jgi:hypothetical protein
MMAALLVSGSVPAAVASSPARLVSRVVIVLAPYLTWDDVMHGPMPATRKVAGEGLVADMNVRSGAVGTGGLGLAKGALLLSTGASALSDPQALQAYSARERVDGALASEFYRRVFGRAPGSADVLFLGAPQQVLINSRETSIVRIGALGGAVRAAGGMTGALGNSDLGFDAAPDLRSRPAGIVAADEAGLVDKGDVSNALLASDPVAPYGVSTDLAALESAYAGVAGGLRIDRPSLIVVDPGDLARAEAWASLATSRTARTQRRQALEATDRVVAMLARATGDNDLLIVMPIVVPEVPDEPSAFAPLVIRGRGLRGLSRTASTHRDGVCTIMDVSATALDALGVAAPSELVGSAIKGTGSGAPLEERVVDLTRMNDTAVSVEAVRAAAVNWFITLTVLVLLGSTLLLFRGVPEAPATVWRFARWALVLVPCVLLAGLLEFAVWSRPSSPGWVVALLVGATAALWAGALALARGRAVTLPLIAVTGLTAAALLVDQWLGAPLSFAGLFGYAPLFGARYYGIGNEMAGLLLGSAMVCGALVLDTWRDSRWAHALRRWGWPLLGVAVVGTAAAPFFGANVGAVAWMTVGFAVGWLMLNGKRVWIWRNAVVLVVLIAVVVAGLGAIDLLGGAASETHLGRAISNAGSGGGIASLMTIVARKAETNLRVMGRTNWTWLLVAVLLLLGYMRWRPRGEFAAMLRGHPAFSAILGAALFAGIVGNFTEDSGVIIPALILLPVGVTALYLMLDSCTRKPGEGS